MNLRLKVELWEIQVILYLILAQMVQTDWIMWVIRIYAFLTFIRAIMLLSQAKKRGENIE